MRLKKLDKLMVASFWPPFIATFFIALFVLVMQSLFLVLDDIAGKGVSFFFILEMLGYMSVALFPMALPIAMLISTVMVFGNLGESYELSSIKSAGVSLIRTMRSIIVIGFCISLFSYYTSDVISPYANLQFKSRMYDLQHQKPTLSLTEGMFNDDFNGYSIWIGNKNEKTGDLEDVLLVDFSDSNVGSMMEVLAETGNMQVSSDGKYLIMELYEGSQYHKDGKNKSSLPFTRTSFSKYRKVFDLTEFDLDQTDQDLFKEHHSMLSVRQLNEKVDSVDANIYRKLKALTKTTKATIYKLEVKEEDLKSSGNGESKLEVESESMKRIAEKEAQAEMRERNRKEIARKLNIDSTEMSASTEKRDSVSIEKNQVDSFKGLKQRLSKAKLKSGDYDRVRMDESDEIPLIFTFSEKRAKKILLDAKVKIRNTSSKIRSDAKRISRQYDKRIDYMFQLHNKFCLALACLIFVFIGVPMGAIVQKGGFGYPLLVSITFFILFNMGIVYGKKLAETFVLDVVIAAWLPCLIMFPFCVLLTWMAMHDRKLKINLKGLLDRFTSIIRPSKQ